MNLDNIDSDKKELNIIVADNDNYTILIMEKYLSIAASEFNISININSFDDGSKAIEYFKSLDDASTIDCIFMDIEMPLMDGYDSSVFIRTQREDILIVAITGQDKIIYEELFSLVLFKPINYIKIKEIILSIISASDSNYLFDFGVINEFKTLGKEFVLQIINEWKNIANSSVDKVKHLINEEYFDEAIILMNSIKAMSYQIGCIKVGNILNQLINNKKNDPYKFHFELDKLKNYIRKSKSLIVSAYDFD
jgi:CheY-like chemotaxis protein